MTATALSDFAIAFTYGLYVFLVGLGHTWRDARQQLGASL
jgi:hypothetical protein